MKEKTEKMYKSSLAHLNALTGSLAARSLAFLWRIIIL